MEPTDLYLRFGAALLLGVLVGLQREFAAEDHPGKLAAGIRTFPLLAVAGCASALLSELQNSPWPLVATVLVVGGLLAIHYAFSIREGEPGLTTKTAALVTVFAGALCYYDRIAFGVALAVVITLLLSAKRELHGFVRHLTRADIGATLKFALITAVVLPVLPNQTYGPPPIHVFNPFKIWLLVVLVSGISFVGYILTKAFGSQKGIRLTGLLGGLASSTAVTLSITQLSRRHVELARAFATAIVVAWTIMFARVLVIMAAVNRDLARQLLAPLLVTTVVGAAWCAWEFYRERADHRGDHVKMSNPFELGTAIKFGLLFTVILAVAKVAHVYLGTTGIYVSSFVGGLADVDAIALSMAKFNADSPDLSTALASRAIMIACVANTFLKGCVVFVAGSPELKKAILPGWILMMLAAAAAGFLF